MSGKQTVVTRKGTSSETSDVWVFESRCGCGRALPPCSLRALVVSPSAVMKSTADRQSTWDSPPSVTAAVGQAINEVRVSTPCPTCGIRYTGNASPGPPCTLLETPQYPVICVGHRDSREGPSTMLALSSSDTLDIDVFAAGSSSAPLDANHRSYCLQAVVARNVELKRVVLFANLPSKGGWHLLDPRGSSRSGVTAELVGGGTLSDVDFRFSRPRLRHGQPLHVPLLLLYSPRLPQQPVQAQSGSGLQRL